MLSLREMLGSSFIVLSSNSLQVELYASWPCCQSVPPAISSHWRDPRQVQHLPALASTCRPRLSLQHCLGCVSDLECTSTAPSLTLASATGSPPVLLCLPFSTISRSSYAPQAPPPPLPHLHCLRHPLATYCSPCLRSYSRGFCPYARLSML